MRERGIDMKDEDTYTGNGEKKKAEKAYYVKMPVIGKNGPSKLRQQFNRGITMFLVVAACIIFYFALLRFTDISALIGKIFEVLKPVLYGCVIAYLLNPVVKKIDKYLLPVLNKRMKNKKRAQTVSRTAGIVIALLFMILLIGSLFNLLVPELYSSVRNLIFTLPRQLNEAMHNLNNLQIEESTTNTLIKTALEEGSDMITKWMRTDLLEKTNEIMSNLTVGVISFISEIFNILIGIIVSIYILFGKETFACQCKKAVYAVTNAERANLFLHLMTKSNKIFGGFIIGKIIDSAIIGVLCFVGLSILNMPYTVLVSVIVGVTNVIPFFGPYIGAIPSALLILLVDPVKGLWFIVFILLLQQFDGNVLGPKILGDSTGLSAFWVIVAILLGGGLFGIAGMIVGVPTFAVLYYIVDMLLNNRLEKKKLPVESKSYDSKCYVDSKGTYINPEETVECEEIQQSRKEE